MKLAKSKLALELTLGSHGSTHRLAMAMGPAANERARQTVSSIRRLIFFKRFLVTLVQGERCSQTRISRFLGFGELCAPTMPATDQIATRGLVHLKEHVKLYILSGGRFFLRGSWLLRCRVKYPPGISKFWGFGELYGQTVPATAQIGTQGLMHIKGHIKLYILSRGQRLVRGSWLLGAGVWKFPHTNFEIFGFGGTICTHSSMYRPAMTIFFPIYQRALQTTYSIR